MVRGLVLLNMSKATNSLRIPKAHTFMCKYTVECILYVSPYRRQPLNHPVRAVLYTSYIFMILYTLYTIVYTHMYCTHTQGSIFFRPAGNNIFIKKDLQCLEKI
jgi:hypothetical protein